MVLVLEHFCAVVAVGAVAVARSHEVSLDGTEGLLGISASFAIEQVYGFNIILSLY
jgi:hypothetical protein